MRNLGEVLDRLKAILPEPDRRWVDDFMDRFRYRAPEQLPACWREIQDWLFRLVELSGKPLRIFEGEEWKAEAIALWMDRPLEELWRDGLVVYRDLRERIDAITAPPPPPRLPVPSLPDGAVMTAGPHRFATEEDPTSVSLYRLGDRRFEVHRTHAINAEGKLGGEKSSEVFEIFPSRADFTSRPEEALRQIRGPGPMVDAAGDEDVR